LFQPDDLGLLVGAAHQPGDRRTAAEFIGRPTAGHDDGIEILGAHQVGGDLAGGRQASSDLRGFGNLEGLAKRIPRRSNPASILAVLDMQ
jgi:hypothetical protein